MSSCSAAALLKPDRGEAFAGHLLLPQVRPMIFPSPSRCGILGSDNATKILDVFDACIGPIRLFYKWCHDIGREQAANKPLLKTVFQYVLAIDILFHERTLLESLEPILREDIQKIWDNVPKPQAHKETPLSKFFNVQVVALSSYEEKEEEQFTEQCVSTYVTPVDENSKGKDLLQHWLCLRNFFGFLYDMEVIYFDESVRTSKRQELETKLLQLVNPAYQSMLGHIRAKTLDDFKEALDKAIEREGFAVAVHDCTQSFMLKFDKGCEDATIEQAIWDPSKVWEKLRRDIDVYVTSVCAAKLSELTTLYEATVDKMILQLEEYAKSVVESKGKRRGWKNLDLFSTLFSHDADSMPRVWTGKEDIKAITKTARSAYLKSMPVMTVISLSLMDASDSGGSSRSIQILDPLASSSWEEILYSASP
ncbi:GTP-binding protein that may be involved in cell development (By similarity) [Musa troglodytarum]|uniref:GTP-binding protein that may be involved in cell development By similarity n=1 Tax=Musa troglodytarum TaxID=320322 RepID=A0A9E7F5T9_9LILI|nr:GTP-binding protein that may be involved in cell development (By similarity) [Musa troglodytarum]